MPKALDPYAVLGVTPDATPAEISHAFRMKLRALHPDTRHPDSPGADDKSQLDQLLAAYRVLRPVQQPSPAERAAPKAVPVRVNCRRAAPEPPGEFSLRAGPVQWYR